MTERTPEELAELLTLLAPAPRDWVIAAKALPTSDVEEASHDSGTEEITPLLADLRRRLG